MSVPGFLKPILFVAAATGLLACLLLWNTDLADWDVAYLESTDSERSAKTVLFTKGFVAKNSPTPSVHAPTIAELSDGTLLSVWYGGVREGAGDVALYSSMLLPATHSWTLPVKTMDRQRVASDLGLHIRKLGNAVLLAGENREVWMFFVTASIGGWSTSSINMARSSDGGKNWGKVKRLVSSPFLNISTLTKGHPFFYKDGTIGLPVYHELAGKFSELMRLDVNGKVTEKIRMTAGRNKIQPDIAVIDDDRMLAVLRDSSSDRKLFQMSSNDGGQSWTAPQATPLPNPDAAVSIAGSSDKLVLVYNDSSEHRNPLSLAVSEDQGRSWKKLADIETSELREDNNKDEFSYPYIIQARDGTFHLVYTWKRKQVAYVSFNLGWINSRL